MPLFRGGGEFMPHKIKIVFTTSERVLRSLFSISNGLYKNPRVDHHFDDYQRIEEVT